MYEERNISAGSLLDEIKRNGTVVWGTGFVGEMFCTGLQSRGLLDHISFFCDSSVQEGDEARIFHGRPVRNPSALKDWSGLVCLAVHSTVRDQIAASAVSVPQERICWVYPFLTQVCFGENPDKREIRVDDILEKMDRDEYWLTFRYLAVREAAEHSGTEKAAREIYLKCMSTHCSRETALRRYDQMKRIVADFRMGIKPEPISITQSFRVIDGLHRLAAAKYFGLTGTEAYVFPDSEIYDALFTDKNRLPAKTLKQYLSGEEIKILNGAGKELFGKKYETADNCHHTCL